MTPFVVGGVRQRALKSEPTESGHGAPQQRGGIAQRVLEAKRESAEARRDELVDKPLSRNLRKDWAKGAITAERVLAYATDAAAQGAAGLNRMARTKVDARNAHRDIARALGWPKGAPPNFVD